MKTLSFFVYLILAIFSSNIVASSHEAAPYIEQALQNKLDQKPVWHKLLHYDSLSQKPEVLTESFYLSDSENFSPRAELIATIEAYFSDDETYIDSKAQCNFPARYLWLSQHIDLPNYQFRHPSCTRLEKWAKFDEVSSLSAVMVSGYFGNPASTFGHSLLKFNSENEQRFLDLTFNYGALVPENESVIVYILKGLFGGYESGFSDGYFYSQDMVYSRTEFRDMWDYELQLSDYERHLIMAHLWEVSGKKFKYYFLTENCAFKIGEILALVEQDDTLTQNSNLWYAPIELFNRIEQVDEKRESNYIKNIEFVPSFERKLNAQIAGLSASERIGLSYWIKHRQFDDKTSLSPQSKIQILNTLIAYYEFKNIAEPKQNNYKELKRKVLVARLSLPGAKIDPVKIETLPSPKETSPPMKFAGGALVKEDYSYATLSWSPFFYSATGLNSLQGGELVVFDLLMRLNDQFVELEHLDLMSIRKMPSFGYGLTGGFDLGWNMKLSYERNQADELAPAFKAGLFDGVKFNNSQYLAGTNFQAQPNEAGDWFIEPYLAWHYSQTKFKSKLSVGAAYDLQAEKTAQNHELDLSYFFTTKFALTLNLNYRETSKALISFSVFK